MTIKTVSTAPFPDQKPGTSGLRKKTRVFEQPNYLENFVQSIFNAVPGSERGTLVIGGDGRYFNRGAIQTIIKMAAANGIARIVVGRDGIVSTPAMSLLIRNNGAWGGFILSASHNPGGPDNDFGIKFNMANGGPATTKLTGAMFEESGKIKEYRISDASDVDLSALGQTVVDNAVVDVVDGVEDYAQLMNQLFDFDQIRSWLRTHAFLYDAVNAVTGPYARRIFCGMLGAPESCLLHADPKEDFGGLHPDPNPANLKELSDGMFAAAAPDFAAASDGDGDRNMILGRGIFVSPGDSIAVMTANYWCVPAYASGIRGVARSLPTSQALDIVAKYLNVPYYETPTGWKYFGSLMDSGLATFCAEESFGTGSSHIREKDGIWAVLYWMNMLAARGMSVKELVLDHWKKFGRNYYSRCDYEKLPVEKANALVDNMRAKVTTLGGRNGIVKADDFAYTDPADGSVAQREGIRICFVNGSRIVMRLSATGTVGATLRVYLERFVSDAAELERDPHEVLKELGDVAVEIAEIEKFTGKTAPDVIV